MKAANYHRACSFSATRKGVWVMVNGRMYSLYRGLNSGKWTVDVWDNIWRKELKAKA